VQARLVPSSLRSVARRRFSPESCHWPASAHGWQVRVWWVLPLVIACFGLVAWSIHRRRAKADCGETKIRN
jgi:hypothetical protein